MLALLVSVAIAGGDCAGMRSPEAQIVAQSNVAQVALFRAQIDLFGEARARAEEAFPCLEVPLDQAEAAAWYRMVAFSAFAEGQEERAHLYLVALLSADRSYAIAEEELYAEHPLRALLAQAKAVAPGESKALVQPAGFDLRVDGRPSLELPLWRPALVQLVGPDQRLRYSRVHEPGEPPPDWVLLGVVSREEMKGSHQSKSLGLVWASVASAVGAGAMLGGAWALDQRVEAGLPQGYTTPGEWRAWEQEAQGQIRLNHGLVLGAGGLALASAGMGLLLVVGR
jgi:hypothetical protein